MQTHCLQNYICHYSLSALRQQALKCHTYPVQMATVYNSINIWLNRTLTNNASAELYGLHSTKVIGRLFIYGVKG